MLKVDFVNRQKLIPATRAQVSRLMRIAAPPEWGEASISVAVVGHEEMVTLNRQFTGREGDTDVLAFPLDSPSAPGEEVVGEVIVCASRALREAEVRGVAPEEELALYLVHGAVHLQGYDDHSPLDRRRMYAREAEVMARAGIPYVRRHARRRGGKRD